MDFESGEEVHININFIDVRWVCSIWNNPNLRKKPFLAHIAGYGMKAVIIAQAFKSN